ncbi:LLM class flavin-dependent oxidoreductase [Arthrobacter ginkgonis]|uniref:LLM class flavin-dependent oxidoreductase n=1 Tax=Arthrobacter ginkgonis TaxID=1630594 RepID=A0ABP7CZU3_9MICC
MSEPLALSVLDLATVADGATEAEAVNQAVALAQCAEEFGYQRFWTAEHHSMPTIASSAPDLIALRIADTTSHLRVGAGGVMLPNHSALQVAERYLTLEAFHPGRIDLGVGRAPGTDPATSSALRRSDAASYPDQLAELDAYLDGTAVDPRSRVRAVPRGTSRPPLFLLGSSLASVRLAATRGDAFAFAGHFSPDLATPALRTYREHFTAGTLQRPHAILSVAALAAETKEHTRWIAGATRLAAVHAARGIAGPLPSPETAARHHWSEQDHTIADSLTAGHIIGDQDSVHDALQTLAKQTGADELMITANVHGHDDHVRSLQLISEAIGAQPAATSATASVTSVH